MLNARYRFHSRGGVNFVRQKGKSLRTPHFAVNYCLNTRGFRRFAVVVSKRVDKRAVVRNRIRRRVYEAIRHEFPDTSTPPTDFVFIIYNPSVATIPFTDLRRQIADAIHRALSAT